MARGLHTLSHVGIFSVASESTGIIFVSVAQQLNVIRCLQLSPKVFSVALSSV